MLAGVQRHIYIYFSVSGLICTFSSFTTTQRVNVECLQTSRHHFMQIIGDQVIKRWFQVQTPKTEAD